MNQKEFLDELNKRKDGFILNQNKYYSVVTDSFNTDIIVEPKIHDLTLDEIE